MSIRIRFTPDGKLVAVCAATTEAQAGDLYLDDAQHRALMIKFMHDLDQLGDDDEEVRVMREEEGWRDAAAELRMWSAAQGGG